MRKSFDENFDEHGVLRDGKSFRVRMGDSLSPLQKAIAARTKPRITDGRGGDPTSLQRPGFRVRAGDARQKVADAYARYETELCNRYRVNDDETLCPQCGGEGYVNGDLCQRCAGDGVVDEDDFSDDNEEGGGFGSTNEGGGTDTRSDSRSVNLAKHRELSDRLTHERDVADSNAWRGKS